MPRQVLFVTYLTEGFKAGFLYSADFARLMDKDISVLVLKRKEHLSEKIESVMTSVAFPEANEHESARMFFDGHLNPDYSEQIGFLNNRCSELEINLRIFYSKEEMFSAIRRFINKDHDIDMVILGATVTENGNLKARELKRLVKTSSKPIVTIGLENCLAKNLMRSC